MRNFLLLSVFIIFSHSKLCSQQQWINFIDSVSTLSSPRSVDLNNDGIKDIVVGSGTDSQASSYGILAFNGLNGELLWSLPSSDEIFTSAVFNDINNDQIPDVFIGGRNAQLYAIDGSSGTIIWEYFPQDLGLNPSDSGLYNFYSCQLLDDQNGDNVQDILVTNGGDNTAGPFDPRPPGNLMVISGLDGENIAMAQSPDSAEIYCSPVILDHGMNNSPYIIFGTGGEQNAGSMFVTTLNNLLNNNISNATVLISDENKGYIAPASLADLTNDGFSDIIVQSFGGVIQAFDGLTFSSIWSNNFEGCESSSAPTIGNFSGGDLVPDVFNVVYRGTTPSYFDYYQIMIDGASGEIVFYDSIAAMHFPSSSAFDANGDGRDEVLISVNDIDQYFTNRLILIDFQNDTIYDVTESRPGVNLACTPLIEDLDNDGFIEFIYTSKKDSSNPSAWNGFEIFRYNTTYNFPLRGIAWGAYMGTSFNGHYTNLLSSCNNISIISSWNETDPTCNNFNNGSVFPSLSNSNHLTFLWSNSSVEDSLVNVPAGDYEVYIADSNNCLEIHTFQLSDPYIIEFGNVLNNNCVGDSIGRATVSSNGCICQFSTCTYNWSNGSLIKHATNLPAGYHTVELTHADGCVVVDSIYIEDGLPVIDSFQIENNLSCFNVNDGSIVIYPNDTESTIFTWSNGDSASSNNTLSAGVYEIIVSNNYCVDSISFIVTAPDSIGFNYNFQNLNCSIDSSGLIEFSTSNPNYPFTYHLNNSSSLSPIFNNLVSGQYNLFIQDTLNCFSDTISINLLQSDSIFLSFENIIDNNCLNDSIAEVKVFSNGCNCDNCDCSYYWSNGSQTEFASNLSSGTYYIQVNHNNNCTITDSIYIEDGFPVVDSFLVNDVSCYYKSDGEVILFPYDSATTSYEWSNGSLSSVNNYLDAGIYSVIASNINCADTISFTINNADTVFFSVNTENLICYEDSSGLIELLPLGQNYPYSYYLNYNSSQDSIFSNLSSDFYSLFIENSLNCFSDTVEVLINQPDVLSLSFDVIPESSPGYLDGSITANVTGGAQPYSYLWDHSPLINDFYLIYLSEGTYSLEVTDANGCQIMDSAYVDVISAFPEISFQQLNIFPNPTNGNVQIKNQFNKICSYVLYSIKGEKISELNFLNPHETQTIYLQSGIYNMKIYLEKYVTSKKIVVY